MDPSEKDQAGRGTGTSKGGTKRTRPDTYVGHTAELGNNTITNDGNKPNQFKELVDRLSTYAAAEFSAEVGTAIDEMRPMSLLDFMPPLLTEDMYSTPKLQSDGITPATDKDGEIIWEPDVAKKVTLEEMQKELVKKQTAAYTAYNAGLKSMFRITLGQVDKMMKQRLEAVSGWTKIKSSTDTIQLLMVLRDLCYKDSLTSVHRMTNVMRAQRKLLTIRQHNDDCSSYVRKVIDRYKILKALGGSILNDEVIAAAVDYENMTLQQYEKLSPTAQQPLKAMAEQRYLGALIVEGSDQTTSTLRDTLAQQLTLGQDMYPKDSTKALDMLIQFEITKKPAPKVTKRGSERKKEQPTDGKESKKDDKSDGNSSSTKRTGSVNVNKSEKGNKNLTGAQVLLQGLASDESFNVHETIFFQWGELQHCPTDDASVHTSSSSHHSEEDWEYWANEDASVSVEQPSSDLLSRATNTYPDTTDGTAPTAEITAVSLVVDSDISPISNDVTPVPPTSRSEEQSTNPKRVITNPVDPRVVPVDTQTPVGNKDFQTQQTAPPPLRVTRPDPPGRVTTAKLRSEPPTTTLRSGHPDKLRSENVPWALKHTNSRVIDGLNLAVSEAQYNIFLAATRTYAYPAKIHNMFAQHRGGIDPNWILLDSESSVNLIVNKNLLTNIRTAPDGYNMTVHCNAGKAHTDQIGELPGFGTVWYYKQGIANVLSLGLITNKFRVTMDTDLDNAICVHRDDGSIRRFHRGDNNLYYYDTRKAKSEETLLVVTTVKGNKAKYSGIDRKRAERAYKLQEIMQYPSDADFLKMVDNKVIKNCPITRRDIKMARDIYGKNTAMVKGKTVRKQVPHVREDIESVSDEILQQYKDVTLECDIFYVNGVRFISTISRHINFRTVRALTNARKETLLNAVKTVLGIYKVRGFKVKQVFADNQFKCIEDDLLKLDDPVTVNITAADEHVPRVERNNRTVKERVRCVFSSTPFKKMPIRMVIELVYSTYFWLNSVIPKHGVSQTQSPHEIMTGVVLDAAKHGRYQFGEYLMAHNDETNNSMDDRAADSIFLRPCGNLQGGFYALDLATGRRIHRMHGTPVPMTDTAIARVTSFATKEKAPTGIIFGDANNNSTILDMDFHKENLDDNDASDMSYKDNDDDRSNDGTDDTIVSYDSAVTEVNDTGKDHVEDDDNELAPDPEGDHNGDLEGEDDVIKIANEVSDPDTVRSEHNDTVRENDGNDADVNNTTEDPDDEDITDENDHDARETDDDNDRVATADEENEAVEPETNRRTGLRPIVTRTHNKFGESEGYTTSVIHRGSLFTAGYGPALEKMTGDEVSYMCVAASIAEYNNIEATKASKQYGVREGIKKFGEDGVNAVLKELQQMHDRTVVVPIKPEDVTKEMRDKALPYLMFLKQKRCGKIKGRGCADGRRQRDFISKEDAASPTVSLHALMILCMIDALEGRHVATVDIPGAFLQTDMPEGEDVYIRLDGTMAELLCRLDPNTYAPCMIQNSKRKVLYTKAKKAIYGTLRAALLFWEKLSRTLESWGYKRNPYDACTMNKMINGKQATICWHVDDLKISYVEYDVVSDIISKLNGEFGTITPLTETRGKVHDYLGMTIDYTEKGKVKFSMFDYLQDILDGLPDESRGEANSPASAHLFTIDEDAEKLPLDKADTFHHYVAKLLFMAKRTRPDIQTAIAFLCTRVKAPDIHDWKKLIRVMKYLQLTPFVPLVLGSDGSGMIHWYVDASFAVHKDMRSHTGALMTLGQGAVIAMSNKQKINTKSSTEAEVVGVDDMMNIQVWTRHFIDAQCKHTKLEVLQNQHVIYQDNTSAMRLEKYGKASSTKRTRHIDIRYFFITDMVKAGQVGIEHRSTEEMVADYFTKPLQGKGFRKHRNSVQGITEKEYLQYKMAYENAKRKNGTTL